MTDTKHGTGIEWTHGKGFKGETWNPITGCTHVSEGCDHCYAAREASGRLKTHPAYKGLATGGKFTGEIRLLPDRLDQPLRWKRPRMVFVNSMSDLFHEQVPDAYIAKVFAVMGDADRHVFQILTKRPHRMRSFMSKVARCEHGWLTHNGENPSSFGGTGVILNDRWPLLNVWLGTSVENQKWAKVRIPHLLETPAASRFLSCEPLLGPVDLTLRWGGNETADETGRLYWGSEPALAGTPRIDWVIVGGESGPSARPMHPDWARSLRDQAVAAGVPFFFKQWGEWFPVDGIPSVRWEVEIVDGYRMCRVGKKAAGRELDGRTWEEWPGLPAERR